MGLAVRITRGELSPPEIRAASAKCADGRAGPSHVGFGVGVGGVHRYHAEGIAGLRSRKARSGCRLWAELRNLVIQGPDPAIHKVVRWRCADLRAEVARRWSVNVHESTTGAWLGELGLTRLQPRPVHPKKTPDAEATFKNLPKPGARSPQRQRGRRAPRDLVPGRSPYRQKGTHAYMYAPIGPRPLMVRDDRHDSTYIFGATCPQRGVGAAMITPPAITECMNLHLAEISTQVGAGARLCWFVMALAGTRWAARSLFRKTSCCRICRPTARR